MNETTFRDTITLAWKKAQSVFVPYLFIHIASGIAMFAVLILSGLVLFPFIMTRNIVLLIPVGIVMGILSIVGLAYISAWASLITVNLVKRSSTSLKTLARETKGDIWALVKTNIFISLFFLGLLPLGFLSAFTIYIVWSLWASMMNFTFVYEKRRGLDALWSSKAHVQKKFWQTFGLLVISTSTSIVINTLFQRFNVPLQGIITNLLGIFLSVFVLCGLYELFIQTGPKKTVKKPVLWILTSQIGYVLLFLLVGVGLFMGKQQWGNIQKMMQRDLPLQINRAIEQL